jgi:hypothetical protein
MTISSQNRKSGPFLGTDAVSSYPFNFTVFEAADVVVTRTDLADVETVLTLGSGYTVTLNEDQSASPGGTVVLPAPLATGFKLTLTSEIAATQEVDLTNQGGFYPQVVSRALDKLTILSQQLAEKVARSWKIPVSSETATAEELMADLFEAAITAVEAADRVDLGALDTAVSSSQAARVAAELAEDGAVAAQLLAQGARDTAFINANVYADTATGLAAVADGVQFQVVNADGLSIQRYRRDAGPVATPVGAAYPTAEAVAFVRRANTGAVVETINLFNKDDPDYLVDRRVNHVTGGIDVSVGYDASGYIVVKPSTAYRLTNRNRIAWYNAAKVFISGTDQNADPTVTSPAGAAFMRCSLHRAAVILPDVFMVTETTATPSTYVPFGGLVQPSRIRGLSGDSVADGGILPRKNSFLVQGKNLFNVATITPDTSIAASGVTSANAAYDLSDFIPVVAGQAYVGNGGIRFYAAYDASKAIMQAAGSNSNAPAGTVITPAANVAFLRITTYAAETAAFQFEQNTVPTGYESYRFTLAPVVVVPATAPVSTWQNVKAASYGDSITDGNQWQPGIVTALGLDHTRYGVGGRRIAGPTGMCQDSEINLMPLDRELIMVLGGANDWAQSTALGTSTSTNTAEFYGALNQMCEKLTTRWPAATICLITTGYAEYPTRIVDQGWPNAVTNLAGLGTREYAEAIRVAGKRWGLPVLDLAALEGVNSANVAAYRSADGALLHPNPAGGARMARVITGVLRTLAPL